MKIDVKITAWEDDEAEILKDEIVHNAAIQMLSEVMRNREHYGRSFRDNLEENVRNILAKELSPEFKEEVKQLVANDLSKKFTRTKQAKELKEQFQITSETANKSGLSDIIREIVRDEIKKSFKL